MPGPLRSYKAYGNVAPVSPSYLIDAKGTTTETCARPCTLATIDGVIAAAGKYLQLFDSAVAPTGGDVPLRSWSVLLAGPLPSFFGQLGPISLAKGLFFAVSSTAGTYTADATSFDVEGEIGEFEFQHSGDSVIGDLTTGRDVLQVWSEATGPKRLTRVDITNGTGAAAYLMVFATDAAANGLKPIVSIPLLSTDTARQLNFGQLGLYPSREDSNGTVHIGCRLAVSTTPTTLTASVGATNKIRAFYR